MTLPDTRQRFTGLTISSYPPRSRTYFQSLTFHPKAPNYKDMDKVTNLTAQQLRQAADIKEQIDALQGRLNALLRGAAPAAARTAPGRKKISAAGIARIRAAQKARWAALKKSKTARRPKRKISAAGRARLAALARARWAKVKAAGKKSL